MIYNHLKWFVIVFMTIIFSECGYPYPANHFSKNISEMLRSELFFFAGKEQFNWLEALDNQELLEEDGCLSFIGIGWGGPLGKNGLIHSDVDRICLDVRLRYFSGGVDYRGITIGEDPIDITTKTDYDGLELAFKIDWKFHARDKILCGPFTAFVWKIWDRDINNSTDSQGYIENWESMFVRFGSGVLYHKSPTMEFTGQCAINLPIQNEHSVYHLRVSNTIVYDEIIINPEKYNPSIYLSASAKYKRFKCEITYEVFRYGKSGLDKTYHVFFQPDSKATSLRCSVGFIY